MIEVLSAVGMVVGAFVLFAIGLTVLLRLLFFVMDAVTFVLDTVVSLLGALVEKLFTVIDDRRNGS